MAMRRSANASTRYVTSSAGLAPGSLASRRDGVTALIGELRGLLRRGVRGGP